MTISYASSVVQQSRMEPDNQDNLAELEDRLSQMRQELTRMHGLLMLGTSAATIAHEFNNLLTPVVSYAKFAESSDDVDLMKKALRIALRQADMMTSMADRILGLASSDKQTIEPTSLQSVVDKAIGCLCRDLAKDGIKQTVRIEEGLQVLADEKQLQQVLLNLLINARHALKGESGRVTIEGFRKDQDHAVLHVRDTGCGIEPDQLERIFEPFFTTKNDVRKNGRRGGLGLGLAICRDIIESHRGTITAESEPGVGSTFTITLPIS